MVREQPERVEEIKKQALRQELEKRIGRLNAYEQLLHWKLVKCDLPLVVLIYGTFAKEVTNRMFCTFSRTPSIRLWIGAICWLISLPLFAQSASLEQKAPSEFEKALVDMMRRDHIGRTRPTYVSAEQWQVHCDTFYCSQYKTWCEDKRQQAAYGELRLQTLMKNFGLEEQARSHGRLTFFMEVGLGDRIEVSPPDAEWVEVLKDLFTGHSPPGTIGCAQDYPCAVMLRFDKADLKLLDIDVIVLPP